MTNRPIHAVMVLLLLCSRRLATYPRWSCKQRLMWCSWLFAAGPINVLASSWTDVLAGQQRMYQIDYAHPFWLICLLGLAWLACFSGGLQRKQRQTCCYYLLVEPKKTGCHTQTRKDMEGTHVAGSSGSSDQTNTKLTVSSFAQKMHVVIS